MALGQAFIEIHADLRPFRRDLNKEIVRITREFEKEVNKSLGTRLTVQAEHAGRNAGKGLGRGVRQGLHDEVGEGANIWASITSALAGALDDGISALPKEVKAALVTAILAASPLIVGGLGAAVTAGVGLGVAAIGVALATQFEAVQARWRTFSLSLRQIFVSSAGAFQDVLLRVMDTVESRFMQLAPMLTAIFSTGSTFLEPFVNRLLDAIQVFLSYLEGSIGDVGDFVDELGKGLIAVANAAGMALQILASTGEDGKRALRDLIAAFNSAIIVTAAFVALLTEIYGKIRQIAIITSEMPWLVQLLFPIPALIGHTAKAIDEFTDSQQVMSAANQDLAGSQGRVIAKTKEEEQALKDLQAALKKAVDATLDAITSNVDYEESVDRLAESLKENGKNMNIDSKEGRENVRAFASAIENLQKQLVARVQTGELTTEQALALYNKEIERIEALGNAAGITDKQFYDLYGRAIDLGQLQIAPDTSGIDVMNASIDLLVSLTREAIMTLQQLGKLTVGGAIKGVRGFSHGGVAYSPETVNVAEEGPEAIIPLTKPQRAAEIMRQTGLDRAFANSEANVLVYIDGQQMEGRMVRVARGVSAEQGLAVAHGFRGF